MCKHDGECQTLYPFGTCTMEYDKDMGQDIVKQTVIVQCLECLEVLAEERIYTAELYESKPPIALGAIKEG